MGNCCGVQVDLDETQEIQFNGKADRLIQNTSPTNKVTLVERPQRNENRVFQATNVPHGNRNATVVVYSYHSTSPADGTYVVLKFKEHKLYFACEGKGKEAQLVLKEGEDATKITSTADPRVFLMKLAKDSTTDFVFASCVASKQSPKDRSKARVITLLKNINRAAVFKLEEKGPSLESQWFQLVYASQEGAGEQSDECQFQEEQHRN